MGHGHPLRQVCPLPWILPPNYRFIRDVPSVQEALKKATATRNIELRDVYGLVPEGKARPSVQNVRVRLVHEMLQCDPPVSPRLCDLVPPPGPLTTFDEALDKIILAMTAIVWIHMGPLEHGTLRSMLAGVRGLAQGFPTAMGRPARRARRRL